MRKAGALLGLLALVAGGAAAWAVVSPRTGLAGDRRAATQAIPTRIVSMNPCADGILLDLARAEQIAAISHYSQDPASTSLPLRQAMRFAATGDTAEQVIALNPDLVIAGSHVSLPTVMALRRLGIPLLQLPVPQSLDENARQITQIAEAVGARQRGRALNARITQALERARPADGTRAVPALIWQEGGMVPGTGTLADELLTRTGFTNLSASYGLAQWDVMPLENLLARPPALLLTDRSKQGGAQARMLHHPAVAALGKRIAVKDFAPRLLHCAGPTLIEAAARLAAVRREMGGG
jgi:iron complex transport system substrate-binding protein